MDLPKGSNYDTTHTSVKAALNLIPFVGGTLAEIFNAIIIPPIEKRKREWMESVVIALQKLEENQSGFVTQLVNNEEFTSLLISASINAYKTHLIEKHRKLKNALIHSIYSGISFDIKQVYLNFIDELTLHHLEVLMFINDFEDRIKSENEFQKIYKILTQGAVDESVPRMTQMEITTFRYLLKDLEAKGLVFISAEMREIKNQVVESSFITFEEKEKEELPFIKITDFGKAFLEFTADNE